MPEVPTDQLVLEKRGMLAQLVRHRVEFGGENDLSANFGTLDQLLENTDVPSNIIKHSCASNIIVKSIVLRVDF